MNRYLSASLLKGFSPGFRFTSTSMRSTASNSLKLFETLLSSSVPAWSLTWVVTLHRWMLEVIHDLFIQSIPRSGLVLLDETMCSRVRVFSSNSRKVVVISSNVILLSFLSRYLIFNSLRDVILLKQGFEIGLLMSDN